MTSHLWEAFGAMALICMAAGISIGYVIAAAIYERREHELECDDYEERIERNRAEGKYAPRHAESQPRAAAARLPGAAPHPRTSLVAGPVELPRGGAIGVMLNRASVTPRSGYRDSWRFPVGDGPQRTVTAVDLPPVAWPEPGTMRPQAAPSKHQADDTGRLPKVRLATADTGEIRAVGDQLVRAIESGAL